MLMIHIYIFLRVRKNKVQIANAVFNLIKSLLAFAIKTFAYAWLKEQE